jgi:hypothetical protein
MEEKEYYSDGSVIVTSARAVISNKTYAMQHITSVSAARIPPKTGVPALLTIGGGFMLLMALVTEQWRGSCITFGAILLVFGIAMLALAKNRYSVRIASSSGETDALVSRDKGYIQRIVDAISQAIIERG